MFRFSAWIAGLAAIGLAIFSAAPASAVTIGNIAPGQSFSDTISSHGPTFSKDYSFHLTGAGGLTVLASAQSEQSKGFGVDSITVALFDATMNPITSVSGTPAAFLDSLAKTGIALAAGDYILEVFGDVTAGKQAFLNVAIAANNVAATPIPQSVLMFLTGLTALGGLGYGRRRWLSGRTALPVLPV